MRYKKVVNGVTTTYYLDGDKILGEKRSDGKELRYFYDIDGLCAINYNGTMYNVVRNAYGDVVLLMRNELPVAYYRYDASGSVNITQVDDTDDIGNINPFRWKGHYYDKESRLYYANGSYYDPEVCLHLDANNISSVIDNAFEILALDRNGIMCDNILAYLPYAYSIFTTMELSANPEYDPLANKPWWELFWNTVCDWFASIVQIFNNLDIGWKIGIGLALFAAACIITALTAGSAAAAIETIAQMMLTFLVGIATGMAISALMALISGELLLHGLLNGLADAIFWGGVFAFVAASVNAIKAGIRAIARKRPCGKIGCFIAGTLVETEDGLKPIEEIQVGDKVLSYDEQTGEQAYKEVVRLFRNQTKEWYHVFVHGEEIVCTGGHPFYVVGKGFIPAKELKAEDILLQSDGTQTQIYAINIEKLKEPETTYNFEVADFHTYYVTESKVLVHNVCKRDIYKSVKDSPDYDPNFEPVQKTTYKSITNKGLEADLKRIDPGKWRKAYQNGYVNGHKVSVHYFKNLSNGHVFNIKYVVGWVT